LVVTVFNSYCIIGLSPPPGSPLAAPIAMSVAGQKYHYRLMMLWRTIYHRLFFGSDVYRFAPYLPTLIKTKLKISAFTGGLGASSIVASPFLAHKLMYLCNRTFSFQCTD